ILPPAFEATSEKEREQLDYFYLKLAETNPERNSQWWIRYKRAQLWSQEKPEIACEKFIGLANDPLFPLNSLAFLRAHETCEENNPELATFSELNLEKLPPWLKVTAVEILLSKAKRTNNEPAI